jgi:hypothetical protein
MVHKTNRFLNKERINDPNYEILSEIDKEFKQYLSNTASKENFNSYAWC